MMAAFFITTGAPETALAADSTVPTAPAAHGTSAPISPPKIGTYEKALAAHDLAAANREAVPSLPAQSGLEAQPVAEEQPQLVPGAPRSFAPWVMRNALTTLARALWMAATGFAVGFVLWGLSRLIAAWRK